MPAGRMFVAPEGGKANECGGLGIPVSAPLAHTAALVANSSIFARTADASWFTSVIERSRIGASELRRAFLRRGKRLGARVRGR